MIAFAAYVPPWMPPCATPGVGRSGFHGWIAASPTTKISGWPGDRQVRPDADAAVAIGLGARRGRDLAPERRRQHARRPEHGPRLDLLLVARRRSATRTEASSMSTTRVFVRTVDPEPLELPAGRGGPAGRVGRQQAVHRLDEHDRRVLRADRAEVVAQRVVLDLAQGARRARRPSGRRPRARTSSMPCAAPGRPRARRPRRRSGSGAGSRSRRRWS